MPTRQFETSFFRPPLTLAHIHLSPPPFTLQLNRNYQPLNWGLYFSSGVNWHTPPAKCSLTNALSSMIILIQHTISVAIYLRSLFCKSPTFSTLSNVIKSWPHVKKQGAMDSSLKMKPSHSLKKCSKPLMIYYMKDDQKVREQVGRNTKELK